jgi:uncharacterized protein (DUF1501 family)
MLDIQAGRVVRSRGVMTRRDFVRVGALGATGLTLADWLALKAAGAVPEGKAKSVIQIFLWGGPPQTDTFDPKPEAGEDYSGPLKKPIETNVPGIKISELLPLLAKQADKYAILRSMTHGDDGHETAAYKMLSGTMPSAELVYPCIGSVVALKKSEASYRGALPPFIAVNRAYGRFNEAGFLGTDYKAFPTGGDPNSKDFRVQGIVAPGGITPERQAKRRSLLAAVDALAAELDQAAEIKTMSSHQEKAYALIMGDAKKAFDMAAEKDEVRERYGRTYHGQSMLLARRLVEYGVPFITINWDGWDTHSNNFEAMKRMLPEMDKCFSALLEDLAERGLLASTIVTWFGEFGRTPKVYWEPPWNGGRHHYGTCFSAVVAGGGFKGGAVVGASDFRGEQVKDRPIYPWDLSASMYQLLGIDPLGKLPHPQGCVAYVTPLASGEVPSGGILKEIM